MLATRSAVRTITFSDTRTAKDDAGGQKLRERLDALGFALGPHAIVREDPAAMAAAVMTACADPEAFAVVTTGGTGITARDRTCEAVLPFFEKTLVGFGEAFRRLSWDQVGPRAVLSRAEAGVVHERLVVLLPGSPRAVELATDALLGPLLPHVRDLLAGRASHRPGHA